MRIVSCIPRLQVQTPGCLVLLTGRKHTNFLRVYVATTASFLGIELNMIEKDQDRTSLLLYRLWAFFSYSWFATLANSVLESHVLLAEVGPCWTEMPRVTKGCIQKDFKTAKQHPYTQYLYVVYTTVHVVRLSTCILKCSMGSMKSFHGMVFLLLYSHNHPSPLATSTSYLRRD